MRYQAVRYERKGPIALLTLHRSEASNAIDLEMAKELEQALSEIRGDNEVRVVVLAGAGDAFATSFDPTPRDSHLGEELPRVADAVAAIECPTIAAINGDALGQGLELALACDLRLAADSARMGLDQLRRGLIPWDGGTQRLPRLVGRGRALSMILLGEAINAAEAHRIGLVHAVFPRESLMQQAVGVAEKIAGHAPIALRYAKEAVSKGMEMPLEEGLRFEQDLTVILQSTEDRAEGIRSFLEKRQPRFTGR